MTAALPSLVLALLCLLQARAQVPVQPDLDTKKFAGEWHVTAIASNCSIFLKMKDGMKSSMAIVSFTPEENLAMKLVWPLMDKCQEFELLFQQSGQAGHYMGAQEKRNLSVMETDYSHYAVLHGVQHSEAEPSTALQLLNQCTGDIRVEPARQTLRAPAKVGRPPQAPRVRLCLRRAGFRQDPSSCSGARFSPVRRTGHRGPCN
ncbi:lipocalin-15 isoform X3 [Haemorhous mexicanus]|uniref:lipocalin-15 isoform X3 n=1 Tax=Haemorhous mexicanus TaxID=30427 RepID=UPI0028BE6414|nr:lipocalin-15 isoform X3 [Haemorhous mexicanus]